MECLIQGATNLGMQAVSLRYEGFLIKDLKAANIVHNLNFAEENGAQALLLGCHKLLVENLTPKAQNFKMTTTMTPLGLATLKRHMMLP